ncbi:MAG: hypothetical protein AAGA54_35910 [Myxococcota bacterium]
MSYAQSLLEDCEALASGKADVSGLSSWLKDEWIERGRRCHAANDLECLVDNFAWAAWGWRNVYWYPEAAAAMDNFLTCEKPVLEIPQEQFFAVTAGNAWFEQQGWKSLGTVLEESEDEVRTWLTTSDPLEKGQGSHDLGGFGMVHGWENVRLTIGRFTLDVEAELVAWDATVEQGTVELHMTFIDRYDFHPTRNDEASGGGDYANVFPYHDWAVTLVDEGRACEFDVTGDYRVELPIDAAFLAG